jgi:two-component system nitrate/nitrite sensor histidine kinase NarX
MPGLLNHSLLLRAGLAMGLITALAVAGMTSAVLVARSTYGEAAAVNQAGSLRMHSYHIAAVLEADRNDAASNPFGELQKLTAGFDRRISNPRLTDVVNATKRKSIHEAYRLILAQWQQTIRPLLEGVVAYRNGSSAGQSGDEARLAFRTLVAGFVADIDNLVRLLEEDAESRIHMLGLLQALGLFLTLAVAIVTLYLLQIDVLSPLRDLLDAAERAGRGDFSARVSHTGPDELGRLGHTFNTMTADLSKIYATLEDRAAEKTKELLQRNQSLELLYTATRYLTETPVSGPTYNKLLDDITRVVEVDAITLCLKDAGTNQVYQKARHGPIPSICQTQDCERCLGNGRTHRLAKPGGDGHYNLLSIPVRDQAVDIGVLLVKTPQDGEFSPWRIQLLEALGKHIGISVEVTRRATEHRRLALLEERSVMARELHDSLAQSLTYLKFQVTRLSMLTRSGAETVAVDDALGDLKQGIETAYRQLRELLTSFRLQMDGRGLGPALSETVEEFNAYGETVIRLDNKLTTSPFSVNEEIHVLQIVREALSNVVHHSQATKARVNVGFEDYKRILVCIQDNGVGIPRKSERTHHYGLAIMRERARSLHGDLTIEPQARGGTQVSLRFQPAGTQPNRPPE